MKDEQQTGDGWLWVPPALGLLAGIVLPWLAWHAGAFAWQVEHNRTEVVRLERRVEQLEERLGQLERDRK
jgi:hypothetical protein